MTAPAHSINCLCARRGLLSAMACAGISPPPPGAAAGQRAPAFDFPDTPAAAAAEYYLYALSSPVMVRHCKRSYLFGKALADKARMKPDLEALYVACLLHDLGLEPIFAGPEDFETIGGYTVGLFGRLPKEGEEIEADQLTRLKVDRTRGRRILAVRVFTSHNGTSHEHDLHVADQHHAI